MGGPDEMRVEQAIYTSLPRASGAGYHVVSRSPGVSNEEARSLAAWSPSHGALLLDASNRASVNFHPLAGGRYAISRSCAGRPEYSGRGGRQTYTHALIRDESQLERSGGRPFAVLRAALALGHLLYRAEPEPLLEAIELGQCHPSSEPGSARGRSPAGGMVELGEVVQRLCDGESVQLRYPGDRIQLTESLLESMPPAIRLTVSFSTSLKPSAARPYRLTALA